MTTVDQPIVWLYISAMPRGARVGPRTIAAVFLENAGRDQCWDWPNGRNQYGYGTYLDEQGKRRSAHRVAYEMAKGTIPDGLVIDHLCRNRACINPAHLEAVTTRTNVLRSSCKTALNFRKTHCKNGHEFTPENTYTPKTKYGGGRICRTCQAEYHRVHGVRYRKARWAREKARRAA
jgi:hypothetical protein